MIDAERTNVFYVLRLPPHLMSVGMTNGNGAAKLAAFPWENDRHE